MPRQINPGKHYKGWVPKRAEDKDEDFVFPELRAVYQIDDDEWGTPQEEETKRLKSQFQILSQALESCMYIMFNDWFKDFRTDHRRIFAKGWLLSRTSLMAGYETIFNMDEGTARSTILWVDYCCRIIDSEATGHYVGK